MSRPALALAAAAGLAACTSAESAYMLPGQDCLTCHKAGSTPQWTAAGTVYVDPEAAAGDGEGGVTVHLTDRAGRTLSLETNSAGNFYTAEPLELPLQVAVERQGRRLAMSMPAPSGGCNGCHNRPPLNGAPGRVYAP